MNEAEEWPKNLLNRQILFAEHEVHRSDHAEACPQEVPVQFFLHKKQAEGNKDTEGDDFLQDFQLGDRHDLVSQAIGRHLKQVFEQGNAPTDQGGDIPFFILHVPKVAVPGEGHKHIGGDEHQDGA